MSRFKGGSYDYFMSGSHYIMLYSPQARARELARQIGVEVMEDQSSRMSTSSILQLVMRDIHPERAEKVLAKAIEKYNELTKTYYMTSNAKTMEFIDNRLEDLSGQWKLHIAFAFIGNFEWVNRFGPVSGAVCRRNVSPCGGFALHQ